MITMPMIAAGLTPERAMEIEIGTGTTGTAIKCGKIATKTGITITTGIEIMTGANIT
jgi:hypothetical protein